MSPAPRSSPCPCGAAVPYAGCCGRYIGGAEAAPDAETLMRSRYTAYVLQRHDYVLATWHASTRPAGIDAAPPGLHWLGLEVRHATNTADDSAQVEFVARSKRGGRAQRLHETSRFVREGGRWYYVDGDVR
jgi:SEC-C motif domain protein